MATIIYLHGFASVGKGPKYDALCAALPEHEVLAPDLPIDPDEVIKKVKDLVRNVTQYPLLFVGTSLGGFWANYFAHVFDTPCVLVNPSMNPSIGMKCRIGKRFENYITGEPIYISEEILNRFAELEEEEKILRNGYLINLFVAEDDDVLPYKETLKLVPYHASCIVTSDGGHRFEKNWPLVLIKVKNLLM